MAFKRKCSYGILGIGIRLKDPELVTAIYQIYNDWVADFCKSNPTRFAALACLPNHDPQSRSCRTAARRQAGAKGADVRGGDCAKADLSPRLGCPLGHRRRVPDADIFPFVGILAANSPMRAKRKSTIFRFEPCARQCFNSTAPNFYRALSFPEPAIAIRSFALFWANAASVGFPMCSIAWITSIRIAIITLVSSLKPSEFWRRQGYTTYQKEEIAGFSIPLAGEDNVIWGSDYPHPDCVWPDSKQIIRENLGNLDERVRRKVVCENAGRLYGFLS